MQPNPYVANRMGAIRLVEPLPPAAMQPPALTKDQDHMAKSGKKRGIRHSKETIAGVLARLDAGESGAAVSRDTGISEATISVWKRKKETTGKTAAKKAARAAAPKGNGAVAHANGKDEAAGAPTLVLTGLRAWVREEVRKELDARLRLMQSGTGR